MDTDEGLNLQPNLCHPDDFYAALMEMHRELSDEQSQLANAKLVLLLANHIGEQSILSEALRIARQDLD